MIDDRRTARHRDAGPCERGAVASYAQEEMFEGADDGWSMVNVPVDLRLAGPLDVGRLQEALDGLVARHEGLRTRLVGSSEGLEQRVAPPTGVDLVRGTIRAGSARIGLRRAAREQAVSPFRLAGGNLFRASVFTLDAHDHVALLAFHHAISDGWSRRVVVDDLVSLYETPEGLERPAARFVDYASSERTWETSGRLRYWRAVFEKYPPQGVFRDSPPRPLQLDDHSLRAIGPGESRRRLSPTRTRRLAEIAGGEGTTLGPALIAAAGAVVGKWSGCRLSVGTWTANRERRELRGVVGCLADVLPVAVDMSGDPTFRELVARVGESYEESLENRVPTGALVPLAHGHARGRLFDVMLNYLPARAQRSRRDGAATRQVLGSQLAVSDVNLGKGVIMQPARQWPSTASIVLFRPTLRADGALYGFANGCYVDGIEWPPGVQERFETVLEVVTGWPELRLSALQDALAARDA